MGHWDSGTKGQWDNGIKGQRDNATKYALGQLDKTMGHINIRAKGQKTNEQSDKGTLGPWDKGRTKEK